jgi:hypothetical protein
METEPERVVVEPVERPNKPYEGWRVVDVRIETSLAEYLEALGEGDLSQGIRLAAKFHQQNVGVGQDQQT